jgi:hypothetical protein
VAKISPKFVDKLSSMSILNNSNNKKGKQGKKDLKNSAGNSKFIAKPTKSTAAQRPHKAGGTRGS